MTEVTFNAWTSQLCGLLPSGELQLHVGHCGTACHSPHHQGLLGAEMTPPLAVFAAPALSLSTQFSVTMGPSFYVICSCRTSQTFNGCAGMMDHLPVPAELHIDCNIMAQFHFSPSSMLPASSSLVLKACENQIDQNTSMMR